MGSFYETESKIWASLGRSGSLEFAEFLYTGSPHLVRFHLVRSPVKYGFQTVLNSMDSPV